MLKNFNASGPALILIAAVLWAFDGVMRRYLQVLPPITVIFFEHLVGLLLLLPFVYKHVLKVRFSRKDFFLIILISALSGLLGTMWFTTALFKVNFISFSVVFLLQKLQPIFAITTASIFLKEKLNKKYIIWALVALVSAYFVTFKNGVVNLSTGAGTVFAALYALGAAFAWGTSTTFSKMLLGKISAGVSTFYRFLFTALIALPVLLLFGQGASLKTPSLNNFAVLVLIAVSSGMVALFIYYKGLSKTPVHVSTILELIYPFIAVFLDMILYGTRLSISQWLAAFVLVLSIYKITELQKNQRNIIDSQL